MDISRNRKLGVAAVVVVALAAGGAALAAGKLHGSSGSSSGLRGGPPGFSGSAPSGTFNGPRRFGYGPGGFRDRDGDGGFGGGLFGGLGAASSYLGLSTSQLMTQVAAGKTLAQIANATSGKSASGLIDAMVAAQKKQLDQAVSNGRLTKSQADQLEANLKTRVTSMVNGTFGPGRGGFFGGGRPGGQGGFGYGGPQGSPQGSPPGRTSTTPATHI